MQRFSIVSVAFNGYERYIDDFIRRHTAFSDDIIIDTIHDTPMGRMRDRAMRLARHRYIVNLDIDDEMVAAPDTFSDFVGLGWVEGSKKKAYWLPGEKRTDANTIRSNFMISKKMHREVPIPNQDFYIYEYIRRLHLAGATFARTSNICVKYKKHEGSVSADPTSEQHEQARHDLRRLDRTIR